MTGAGACDDGAASRAAAAVTAVVLPPAPVKIALKRRAEFQRAAKGRRSNAKSLTLQSLRRPQDEDGAARFGLTVTKRVGNAVERNRIKRRFRAALRTSDLAPATGHDYVIVARREALDVSFDHLVADLVKTLEQARSGPSGRPRKPSGRPVSPRPSA